MAKNFSLIQNLTVFLLNSVDHIFQFDINVKGLDKLLDSPSLFVPNHFTRAETVLVPYVLHKYRSKQIRSLASEEFFEGQLGKLLNSIGALSVDDENRDEIIINDLMTNKADWVIYPEGSMVKNKRTTTEDNQFNIQSPHWQGSMRTGAVVLAIKAELARMRGLLENPEREEISHQPIHIVPVNISYYPLRGENLTVKKLVKEFGLSEKLENELMLEANLLFNSRININIGEPFDINKSINSRYNLIKKLPFIKQERKDNLILNTYRQDLTHKIAERVYNNLTINIEHLFAFYLYESKKERIDVHNLKKFIVRAILLLFVNPKNHLDDKLTTDAALVIFVPKKYKPFELIVDLGKQLSILIESKDDFIINQKELNKSADFYDAPIKSPFRVIYNEFLSMSKIIGSVRDLLHENFVENYQNFPQEIVNLDKEIFDKNYQKYYEKGVSTKYEYGLPFLLKSKKAKKKVCLLFSHGYLACPQEIAEIAQALNQNSDIAIYAVRLAGHGTHPKNIKDVGWKDWLQSYWNGVAATLNEYDHLFFGGFSTGGLLSLICASELNERISGVFAINPPISLNDIRSHLVPAVNVWNDMLSAFNLSNFKYEYIENEPIYPETNYDHNYFQGVEELGKLIKITKKRLNKITIPTMLINSTKDLIVNPNSSQYVYDNLCTENKKLHTIDTDEHIIVRGQHKDEVTALIDNFIKDIIA